MFFSFLGQPSGPQLKLPEKKEIKQMLEVKQDPPQIGHRDSRSLPSTLMISREDTPEPITYLDPKSRSASICEDRPSSSTSMSRCRSPYNPILPNSNQVPIELPNKKSIINYQYINLQVNK